MLYFHEMKSDEIKEILHRFLFSTYEETEKELDTLVR